MELKLIEERDKEIEIEVIGEKTLLNSLKGKLLENESVEYAECRISHPTLSNPRFYLRVKKGDARETMMKAVEELIKEAKEFKKLAEENKEKIDGG